MSRILVVDDQKTVRETIRIPLEARNHEIIEAEDGDQAIKIIKDSHVDLIITDIVMPVMNGIELVKAIRKISETIPILAVSGGGGSMPAAHSLKIAQMRGATDILYKPFSPPELLRAVAGLIG